MINYANEEITFNGCPGCAFARHEFSLPCGIIFENDNFTLAQDWELPIEGFLVVSTKRHVEKFEELTTVERHELFDIVDKAIAKLRNNNICDRFNVIFEEKEDRHFHVWIMPRHKWMKDLVGNITEHIGIVFKYAKENFRGKETYDKINEISLIMKKEMEN